MRKSFVIILLIAIVGVPVSAQRFRRGADRLMARSVGLAQVWRLTTLTMDQRTQIRDLMESALREVRESDQPGRREMRGRQQEVVRRVEGIVGPANVERSRLMPSGPLAPEEVVYYPITSLSDLAPERRDKIDAVFKPILESARSERRGRIGGAEGERPDADGGRRQRARALFEVLEALLTRDQLVAVKQFLPQRGRMVMFRPQTAMRIRSLTLEQESQLKAVFAAFDDETAADRARLDALRTEKRSKDGPRARRSELAGELRQIEERLRTRQQKAYDEMAKVLTPDQMKELQAMSPGPDRPIVFAPERLRALTLTPEQQRTILGALREFKQETRSERMELAKLREELKDSDVRSMESAPLRDKLRKQAAPVTRERDELMRTIADALTGEQLATLVQEASNQKEARGRRAVPPPAT